MSAQISQITGGFRKFKRNLRNFHKLKLWFHNLQNCLATNQLSILQWFLSSSYFTSWLPQLAKLLDGWFLLWFSSLHPHLALAKGYEAPKLSFFWIWASTWFSMNYTKISLILGLLWWSKSYEKYQNITQFDYKRLQRSLTCQLS